MDVSYSYASKSCNESHEGVRETSLMRKCRFPKRQSAKFKKLCAKEERNASIKRVSLILQKSEDQRTIEETETLLQSSEEVEEVQLRWKKREEARRRLEEFEEPMEALEKKCLILAQAIAQSQHLVVYTGAGISTAARIPDYRGSNGIWTRLQQGKDIGNHDLSLAEPTYTHMALSQLYHQNILKYVVSQNCDGLHLRSGLPRHALSELHGNMYVEVCKTCKPAVEYWRRFDVTENTARYSHKTMRKCYKCSGPLVDTIVHFGERGILQWPLNWSGASKNAQKATTILCLGSSLKVLKRYPWLWQMDKPVKKRPNLYIVNLQWTPKDDCANVKLHGKCDVVMKMVMNYLGIIVKPYDRIKDPIFYHATELCDEETHTTTQPFLKNREETFIEEKNTEKTVCVPDVKQKILDEKGENIDEKHSSEFQSALKDCDTETYISNNSTKNNESSKININSCGFSIDNIIQEKIKTEEGVKMEYCVNFGNGFGVNPNLLNRVLVLPQNYPSFVTYYHFRNAIILQNPILSYQDMMYYPYQTSFLYSGIHNIINPLPQEQVTVSDQATQFNGLPNKEESRVELFEEIEDATDCKFCKQEFQSPTCLFYPKSKSVFIKRHSELSDKRDSVCLCCDYSSDEDKDSKNNSDTKTTEKEDIEIDKEQMKNKIQAGWFGKGYRKIKKPRKR